MDAPLAVFTLSLVAMWLSTLSGAFLRNRIIPLDEDERKDLGIVVPATLTLPGLIIGFSFSMASNRYDQRKANRTVAEPAVGHLASSRGEEVDPAGQPRRFQHDVD